MAELDPKLNVTDASPETAVIIEEIPLVIPPNRPRKVYAGMWGPLEIGAVAAGALAMAMALILYFFWVVPSNRELARNKAEADRLDAELVSANTRYGEMTSTDEQVSKIVGSVDDFETRFLQAQTYGQTALYQRLNGLIKAYGLVNTTGPDYAPLDNADIDPTKQAEEEKGREKYRSLYPGVYVTTTVEGSYQNLRRFIREIETGHEFLIISSVELVPSDDTTKKETDVVNPTQASVNPVGPAPGGKAFVQPAGNPALTAVRQPQSNEDKGKAHGETVALHLEMAAYFRRPNFAPMSVSIEQ